MEHLCNNCIKCVDALWYGVKLVRCKSAVEPTKKVHLMLNRDKFSHSMIEPIIVECDQFEVVEAEIEC